jgi:hypothetical protein
MEMSNNIHPKWWQLYLTFPLLIALFLVDSRLKISTRGHQIVQIGILLLIYGLVHLWLKANSSASSQMDRKQNRGRITVIEIPPYQLSDMNQEKHRLFQLRDSEIKGVLDDTFQMDYIDAESSPVDEVSQEVDKE